MTDEILEQRLRARYRAAVGADLVAPASLRASIAGIATAPRSRPWLAGAGRAFTLLAAAALAGLLIVGGALFVGARFSLNAAPSPSPSATAESSPLPSTDAIALPSTEASPSASAAEATPAPTPQPTPVPLIAVYHGLGDTAQILTLDPNTGAQVLLGTVPVDSVQLRSGVYGSVEWSADRGLVTASRVTDGAQVTTQIDTATHASTTVTVGMESYVSPQGDQLAGFGGDWDGGAYGLVVTDLAGNVLQRPTLPADGSFMTAVTWAPDGSALILNGYRTSELATPSPAAGGGVLAFTGGGTIRLFIVPLDGSPAQELGQSLTASLGQRCNVTGPVDNHRPDWLHHHVPDRPRQHRHFERPSHSADDGPGRPTHLVPRRHARGVRAHQRGRSRDMDHECRRLEPDPTDVTFEA